MKILVTNDDGILSPVLDVLAGALSREHEVIVVAPSEDQSGMSHSFTHGPVRRLSFRKGAREGYTEYQVAGTPSDCIKFAVAHLLEDGEVDLLVSGINLGENAGMSTIYSGTVAAAREGAMWGLPALAVSIWKDTPAHLDFAIGWLLRLLRQPALLPARGNRLGTAGGLWNINFPACDPGQVEGVEVTSMSTVMFRDTYEAERDNHGITRFRLVGYKPSEGFQPGSDDFALARNRIAITPLQVAQHHPAEIARLAAAAWDSL